MKCTPLGILAIYGVVLLICIGLLLTIKPSKREFFAEDKEIWKPRIQDAVRCMLHMSFLANQDTTLYLYGDDALGTALFRSLFKEAGFQSSAEYFTLNLWPAYRTFIQQFPISTKPLTLNDLNEFVQNLPIFTNSERYDKTFEACQADLPQLLDIYNSCKSFDVTRRLYGSSELNLALEKRADYILCALKKSTDYNSYKDALTYARFTNPVYMPNYYIYWNAYQVYNRLRKENEIRLYISNLLYIFFELEWVLSENKESPMISSLPSVSPSCQETSAPTKEAIPIPPPSNPNQEVIYIRHDDSQWIHVDSNRFLDEPRPVSLQLPPLKPIAMPVQKKTYSSWKEFNTLDSSNDNKRMMIVASICLGLAGVLYISAIVSTLTDTETQ